MRIAIVFTLLLAAGAQAQPIEWSGELRLQQDLGGEVIVSVPYSDGSISDLTGGTYFSFMAGGSIVPLRVGDHALELTGGLGFSSWSTGPDNTEDRIQLQRFPLELLAGYRFDVPGLPLALRLGGGLQYQLIGDLYGTGSLEGFTAAVDNSPAWVAELRAVHEVWTFHVRYTRRTYHLPATGEDLDASSLGLAVGIRFPMLESRTGAP